MSTSIENYENPHQIQQNYNMKRMDKQLYLSMQGSPSSWVGIRGQVLVTGGGSGVILFCLRVTRLFSNRVNAD